MHHPCSNCQGITKTKVSPEQMRKMFGENRPENIFTAERLFLDFLNGKIDKEELETLIKTNKAYDIDSV